MRKAKYVLNIRYLKYFENTYCLLKIDFFILRQNKTLSVRKEGKMRKEG